MDVVFFQEMCKFCVFIPNAVYVELEDVDDLCFVVRVAGGGVWWCVVW